MAKQAAMAIVLLAVAAAASLPAALADADLVASTCKSSDNPQCAAVLGADPRSANATTVREFASIALDVAAAAARDASGFLSGEAARRDRTDVGDALSDCVGYYGGAIDALETAREDFDAGAYGEAEKEAGDAEGAADSCEQAFTDRRLESTVSDVDRRMKDRASVAGDLIDLLWGDKRRRSGRRLLRP
ncbi:Pectinesterase inhibitor [Panicum miliaceum]|uniref:Pectinesterase inhibitor n=1 Tax=Panicum miliaceum TaxID=4540 RepID=A0A3L6RKE0_PANMI|nr:Pectinesterase inhibitor [Panicum miliaceum]